MMWLQLCVVALACSIVSGRRITHSHAKTDNELPSCGVPTAMTEEQIQAMVDSHNEVRGREGADQFPLTWDKNLAAKAQEWSEHCIFDHGLTTDCDGGSVGQNVYFIPGRSWSPASTVNMWARERQYWDFETRTCQEGKVCGHWKQVVWSETRKIGCGFAVCVDEGWNYVIATCNYSPIGNWPGKNPFIVGEPCTACLSHTLGTGLKCVSNLCVECIPSEDSECECIRTFDCVRGTFNERSCRCDCPEHYIGLACETYVNTEECANVMEDWICSIYAMQGYCSNADMSSKCRKACGLC